MDYPVFQLTVVPPRQHCLAGPVRDQARMVVVQRLNISLFAVFVFQGLGKLQGLR